MTKFKDGRERGIDAKNLSKEELESMLVQSMEYGYYGSGEVETMKGNLSALTKAFASLVVSKAVIGDHTSIRILTDNVYELEVDDG